MFSINLTRHVRNKRWIGKDKLPKQFEDELKSRVFILGPYEDHESEPKFAVANEASGCHICLYQRKCEWDFVFAHEMMIRYPNKCNCIVKEVPEGTPPVVPVELQEHLSWFLEIMEPDLAAIAFMKMVVRLHVREELFRSYYEDYEESDEEITPPGSGEEYELISPVPKSQLNKAVGWVYSSH